MSQTTLEGRADAGSRLPLELDPCLVEEAVALTLRALPRAEFWRERDQIYEIKDEEERDRRFRSLNRNAFETLGLAAPIHQALSEQPLTGEHVRVCRVVSAVSGQDEGAELFVGFGGEGESPRSTRSIVLKLRPSAFGVPHMLLLYLRHELFHISDMLDPTFGYDPALPDCDGEPARLKLLLSRYRVLWDTVIDGRLWKSRKAPEGAKGLRQREFASTFPMLGDRTLELFEQWFHLPRPTHAALLYFARNPCAAIGTGGELAAASAGICPLCKCSGRVETPDTAFVAASIINEILQDFPKWRPADGICPQCIELYLTRPLSRAAAGSLPRA